jgi:hypothetical protein
VAVPLEIVEKGRANLVRGHSYILEPSPR